jgi:hypothetical protein
MTTIAASVLGLFYMQQIFRAFVGITTVVATIANVLNKIIYHKGISRLRNGPNPARLKSFLFRAHASMSAIIREYEYYSLPLSFRKKYLYLPPVGSATILVAYVVLIVVCSLYKFNTRDPLKWEDVSYRAGYIAIC